ncbi:T9SS type A sorting domain-containing protein [Aureispira sp. CCB-E]|uniref:T9SS type A sorting domain-containing protein n=1 Tax=Aureispira sp. CCB-E TaxID=3051121 RepID=UPI002868D21F|nr:T9SS type A sorting domain-containing protein [Aureispira sp. CCB-E]WMX12733.1 T9SS type A sorting domain-containing protein [Aureispira sp. CCB-E]
MLQFYKLWSIFIVCFILSTVSSAQTITIVDPNGGEVLHTCQQYTISWNTSGTLSDYYDIDYSLDGGTIWASVTTNYLSTNGLFTWTVPPVQSSTCLIRVKDAQSGGIVDQSDAFFTINTPVTVLAPNGGETLKGGDVHTITWNAIGTSNTYDLYYSTNGGATWSTIVVNYATGSATYNWTVPNIPSSNCLVRVRDHVTTCMLDESDAPFTITPDDPILLSPNGGENLFPGCTRTITWNPATFYSNVYLEYSTDNGVSWTTITSNTSNDGSHSWIVPTQISTTCLIRASNVANTTILDISDATFNIVAPIRVTASNGGDTLYGCSRYTIRWTKPNSCISRFRLYYSTNNGTTWLAINSIVSNSGSGTSQGFNWTVPNGVTSNQALFKVEDYYDNSVYDVSDANFVILPSNDMTITSPNGGEVLAAQGSHLITWTSLPSASGQYNLQYSTNGGGSWTTIVSNITGNAYNWTIPNTPSTSCKIRIVDYTNTCKYDDSDGNFTITPLNPELTAPNGGEILYPDCNYRIEWNTTTFYSNVRLEYSSDNGLTWNVITTSTSNDGRHDWLTPSGPLGTTYLVRIAGTNNLSLVDTSASNFSLVAPIRVTASNGGDTLYGCSRYTIRWTKPNSCISRFRLYYSTNNGTTWLAINSIVSNSGSGTSQGFNWTVPNGVTSNQALFKVEDYYDNSVYDISDANFVILPSNDMTITSPNGGEVLAAQGSHLITWTSLPSASGQYNLQYSTNGGGSWTTIVSNITGNAYNWTIPNTPSTSCKIRIVDYTNTCKYDDSDGNFTITPLNPELTAPNGGEILYPDCNYRIEWNTTTFYSNVRLEYSSDNGLTWNVITTSTSNDGRHDWLTPPGPLGTTYLVRIAGTNNLSLADTSASNFSLVAPIRVTASNGGDTLYGCSRYTIRWTKPNSCISRFRLYYSTNNGTTWLAINSIVSNSGSGTSQGFNWTVPNGVTSNQALFKVEDYYDNSVYDISDANFVILPSNDMTITSPNGGEVLAAEGSHLITWTSLPSASGQYNLQYSTNGGGSWTTIVSNITGNAYNWTIPNTPSTSCKIRIVDYTNTCKYDDSDGNFTITPLNPELTAPNGGEILYPDCNYRIEWNTTTFYSNVRLEYSSDNGLTWNVITTSTSNDGRHDWLTPSGPLGTTYLVRIAGTNNLSLADTSASNFSLVAPIRVTASNGGDTLYGCSRYTIRWTKPNSCISRFRLYYSTNNGTTWLAINSIVSNSGSGTSQGFNWTVPNGVTSNQALFKVEDYYDNSVYDISDANFVILPSNDMTITSPNGGEVLAAQGSHLITWTSLPSASGQYNLQYSTNGGGSWTTIVSNITGNAYNWTIPNTPSTSCKIRIVDYTNTCKYDDSDGNFTITPLNPELTAPNGGEILYPDCNYRIEWNTTTFYSNVRLEYSSDNGLTWNVITTSTSNDGRHDWLTPSGPLGTTYLVRIAGTNNLSLADTSASNFSLVAPIRVTASNGGDTLYGCSRYTIRWTKPNSCISRFRLYYSTNNGTTWLAINSIVSNSGSGTSQGFNWTVPNGVTSNQALFKVEDYYDNSVYDISDANFVILPSNDMTITSPNGGEVIQGLTSHTITWSTTPAASGQYNLQYSTNGGGNWTTIATNITGNAYTWTAPNIPSANYKIRVVDYNNTCKYDDSDASFEVTPATPIMTAPNGGEVWYAGTSQTIRWNPTTYYSNVRIDYSTDNGLSWNTITTNTSNDGTHSWTIPNVASTVCLVRVSNTANVLINDVSDAVFQIKPAVTVLTPNGDNGINSWGGCTVTSITFDHSPAYNRWRILYSLDGGNSWTTIVNNWYQTSNPATYNWTIPNTSSSQVLVKVEPYYNTSYFDQSDATFTVDKPVTIIQPNFGGIMQVGSVYNIEWSSDGISNLYDIFFSDDGGSTWSTVVLGYNTSNNTYPWTVPNAPSSNCLIRIRDNIDNCKEDVSDIPFIISSNTPALTVLSPNGGDTLYGCNSYNITWTEPSPNGTYDLAYTTDGGNSWNDIVLGYNTTTLSYNWTTPNISSSNVLVRVKASSTAIYDLSDALFTIIPSSISVLTADTMVCGGSPVQLNATGAATFSWTPTTGLSNPTIANPIATPSSTTTYIVQSGSGNCVLVDSITITTSSVGSVPVDVTISATPSNTICSGTMVNFTATPTNGGTAPDYQWQVNGVNVGTNSASYSNASLNDNDVVAVVLTSNQACITNNPDTSAAIVMDVSVSSTPSVSVQTMPATTVCSGTMVSFTATPTNGGANPNYQWQVNGVNVGTNSNIYSSNGLLDGDVVQVIMTSNSACAIGGPVNSSPVTMTINTVPMQPSTIVGSTSVCENTAQTFSVNPIAGANSYTWSLPNGWTGTSTTPSINTVVGNAGGLVSVQATNGCGNSPTQSVNTVVNTTPIVAATATNTIVCAGEPVTFAGTGASNYVWDNGITNGATINPTLSATYSVTGTDANGCSNTDQVTVLVNALPNVVANASAITICSNESVTLTGTGANTYTWSNNVTNNVAFSPTTTTTYNVIGTDVNGCTNTDQVTISVNARPNVSAGADQTVCENTMVTLSGSGAQTYVWNNGISDNVAFAATSTATYMVTGTDANGCTNVDTVTIMVTPAPTVLANASSMSICQGDSVTLTGSGAMSYTWNFGVTDGVAFSPSNTLTYSVTGTDVNGCTNTDQITITVNALPTVAANASTFSICEGELVTLTGSGAATYTWDHGVLNGNPLSPASTTTYSVTGTDVNGCNNTDQVTISVNARPNVSAGADQTVCENTMVTLSGSGAQTYVWNNGVSDNVAFAATNTATYMVTGTDANGCTNVDTVAIMVTPAPTVLANASSMSICQGDSVTLAGSGAMSYAWNFGVTDGVAFSPSNTLTYSVTGTDVNGCTNTDQITITVNALPTVAANASTFSICESGMVTLTGSGAATYTWEHGVLNGNPVSPVSTTTYSVTGTDVNGCNNTDQVTIVVNARPNVSANSDTTVCENSLLTLSGIGAQTYTWNNGVTNNVPFTATNNTIYKVIGTDANGCTDTAEVIVTVNPAPAINAGSDQVICDGASVILAGSGATTYIWNNGITDNTPFVPTTTTTYIVTGVDLNNCSSVDSVVVTVNPNPVVNITQQQDEIVGNDGFINLSVTGGLPPFTFDWNNDGIGDFDDTEDLNNLVVGYYAVVVQDVNGCIDSLHTNIGSVVPVDKAEDEGIKLAIFPNPSYGKFTIAINKAQSEAIQLTIFDMSGKWVKSLELKAFETEVQIDLDSISAGAYYIRMNGAKYTTVKRFTIIK